MKKQKKIIYVYEKQKQMVNQDWDLSTTECHNSK